MVCPARKPTALILIPARNEAATIGRVVRGCRRAGFSVTVIDDASGDATAFLAREAGAEVVAPPGPHHGKTAALRYAMRRLPAAVDWLFFLDGDGQHDPADLERFWRARFHADLIVGDRLPDAARMPVVRRWTNRVMSGLLRRSGVRDSQCGFRLVRRAWLGSWLPAGHRFQFETEMALLAAARCGRVLNLPIAATYAGEESKIVPWRDAIHFTRCLWHHRMPGAGAIAGERGPESAGQFVTAWTPARSRLFCGRRSTRSARRLNIRAKGCLRSRRC